MSKFSKEHHVRCPYEKTVGLVENFLKENHFSRIVTIGIKTVIDKQDGEETFFTEYAIFPSSNPEWTFIVSNYDYSLDENLIKYISKESGCTGLYGHNNDQTDNWKWIHFENGKQIDTYHYTGQEWYRFPEAYKKEALDLREMFSKMGTPYQNYSFTESISEASMGTLIRAFGG